MSVQQPGSMVDVQVQPLYDSAFILAAGAAILTFFATPQGQGQTAWVAAATPKSVADTNMNLAGQLPAGINYKVLGFRIVPDFGMLIADARDLFNACVFTFFIGQKNFLQVPARLIPSGVGVYSGGATASGIANLGIPSMQTMYQVGRKPFDLLSGQNFGITLTWFPPQAVATTLAARTTAGPVGLPITAVIDGFQYRYQQ